MQQHGQQKKMSQISHRPKAANTLSKVGWMIPTLSTFNNGQEIIISELNQTTKTAAWKVNKLSKCNIFPLDITGGSTPYS